MRRNIPQGAKPSTNNARTLSARVLDFANKTAPRSTNRVRILALAPDIRRAIQDGWSRHLIWKTLKTEGTLTCSYDTFRAHVKRLLQEPADGRAALPPTQDRPPSAPSASSSGFVFNPVPNKEELF
ncbi:MAG: hypothetical protein A4E19_18720 [Nitrospira sp. SG-bin1]|nr:MAG: hypothetical protein A4E19_18720 [Nitrospira sp. SG-bin1]